MYQYIQHQAQYYERGNFETQEHNRIRQPFENITLPTNSEVIHGSALAIENIQLFTHSQQNENENCCVSHRSWVGFVGRHF